MTLLTLLLLLLPLTAVPDELYTSAFHRSSGWTGADGTYSVPLTGGRTLWMFSDTFFGEVDAEGRRRDWRLAHNSLVVQEGRRFRFPSSGPAFHPPDRRGFLWVYDAVPGDPLVILLGQFESTPEGGAFGFRQIGLWACRFRVSADAEPEIVEYVQLPHFRAGPPVVSFGSAILCERDWTYVYGTADRGSRKELLVGRVRPSRIGEGAAWEFFTGAGWSPRLEEAVPVADGVHNELSVHRHGGHYLLVSGGQPIVARTAPRPEGPWSEPVELYRPPEARGSVFAYNAKAHPELSGPGLLLSYNVNTVDLEQVERDAGLYRPRFVRLRLGSSPASRQAAACGRR